MAGLVGQYNQVPRLFNQVSKTIAPPAVDIENNEIELKNVRGQVLITIFQTDNPNGVYSSFAVTGGFGMWPDDATKNWYYTPGSFYNCTVASSAVNIITVTTAAPAVVRVYRFTFAYNTSTPPTVIKTGGTAIGVETITIGQTKQNIVEGF